MSQYSWNAKNVRFLFSKIVNQTPNCTILNIINSNINSAWQRIYFRHLLMVEDFLWPSFDGILCNTVRTDVSRWAVGIGIQYFPGHPLVFAVFDKNCKNSIIHCSLGCHQNSKSNKLWICLMFSWDLGPKLVLATSLDLVGVGRKKVSLDTWTSQNTEYSIHCIVLYMLTISCLLCEIVPLLFLPIGKFITALTANDVS